MPNDWTVARRSSGWGLLGWLLLCVGIVAVGLGALGVGLWWLLRT